MDRQCERDSLEFFLDISASIINIEKRLLLRIYATKTHMTFLA